MRQHPETEEPPSRVPTLVLWGLSTRPTRRARVARAFPRPQKIVFADALHPCYLKAPSYFNRLLLQFAGASGSGAGSAEEGAPRERGAPRRGWTAAEAAAGCSPVDPPLHRMLSKVSARNRTYCDKRPRLSPTYYMPLGVR